MSTRSRIAIATTNGEQTIYKSIYCHLDRYPEGVGRTLELYYTTRKKIERLMKRGNLSVLKKKAGRNKRFWRLFFKDTSYGCKGNTSFAYRDRGDKHTDAIKAVGIDQLRQQAQRCFAEYLYIWDDKRGWQCEEVEWPD